MQTPKFRFFSPSNAAPGAVRGGRPPPPAATDDAAT